MKTRNRFLTNIVLMMACLMPAIPGMAQVLFTNGHYNGTVDGWDISKGDGYWTIDSFYLGAPSTVTGIDFWVEEYTGDTMLSVQWQITGPRAQYGGSGIATTMGGRGGQLTDIPICFVPQCPVQIDKISLTNLPTVNTNTAGTYYLKLAGAVQQSGSPVYWDQNAGGPNGPLCGGWMGKNEGCPSSAFESLVGTIPSESFDIQGNVMAGNDNLAPR